MTNEELQKLKELAQAATPGPWTHRKHGVIVAGPFIDYTNGSAQSQIASFGVTDIEHGEPERQLENSDFCAAANPEAVLELIALAERATQPAQPCGGCGNADPDKRCIGCGHEFTPALAQDRCCEHDCDCAVHNAPAYPVGPCDCTLSEKPAQDQVAAVRAVPDIEQKAKAAMYLDELTAAQEGQKWLNGFIDQGATIAYSEDSGPQAPRVKWAAIFNSYDRMVAGYLLTRDAMNWTELTLIDCSAGAKATAPSPQPELSGSICPMKTPAIPDEGANEFIELMADWRHAELGSDSTAAFDALVKFIDAWKDAACAVAAEEARRDVHETNVTCVNNMLKAQKRATDSEEKLAALPKKVRVPNNGYSALTKR